MNRRAFLAGAAGVAAWTGVARAQAGARGQAPAGGRQGAPGRGRGVPSPADVPAEKLARVSLMTLQFRMYRVPTQANATPTPDQTLTVFDLPKMYVDYYGVHNIEFQLEDIVQSETDADFIKRLKATLDEHKMTMTQVNMEIGAAQGMTADASGRQQGIDRLKKWVDIANQYGCKRLMLNQNQASLTKDRRADAVAYMKTVADAGRPSGVMFSVETRGAGSPELIANLGMKPWEFMAGIIEEAGANSNVDIGNVGAMNQDELHACIKRWYPTSSGNMHIKSSPYWDMGRAIAYTESLGYQGRYSLEINQGGHPAIRLGYNTVLANVR